ncbi:hypothetical protein [Kitasatospora brasiliensis]|uniref:hypothetical protein n=1 Tax=Kitasatospora brasiliensis TaxID=3058040 RepID=UPI00292FD1B9|nr:hypothetical protein [Kitasatospora sp. K002]
MNLDFSAEPLFSWYVVLLAISGVIMVVFGAAIGGLKVGLRLLNVIIGLGFLGYAYYLAFVFEGGTYTIFFKVFIVPVLAIVASVKALTERGNAKKQQPAQAAAFDPNAPQGAFNPGAPFNPNAPQAPFNPNAPQAPQAPFNPNAPQAPQAPFAPQPGAPVPPVAPQAAPPVPPQGASPYQPGVAPQPVADNPYAQPQPPQNPAG